MTIKKLLFSVFLLTFSFSVIAYFLISKVKNNIEQNEQHKINDTQTVQSKTEIVEELETLDEKNDWIDEEKYPFKIKLLETGEVFHGDEVDAKTGEKWLGLFQDNDKYYLQTTEIKIKRVYDDIVDYKKNRKTGKNVSVKGKNKPLFLLKNSKLSDNKVQTLFRGATWQEIIEDGDSSLSPNEQLTVLKKGFAHTYKIKDESYSLKVIEAQNKENEKILALALSGEGKTQILHTMNVDYTEDGLGNLFWVGDLDGDGKPDFYMTHFVHYNVGNSVLYLSSEADETALVKKVAYFWTTGC